MITLRRGELRGLRRVKKGRIYRRKVYRIHEKDNERKTREENDRE